MLRPFTTLDQQISKRRSWPNLSGWALPKFFVEPTTLFSNEAMPNKAAEGQEPPSKPKARLPPPPAKQPAPKPLAKQPAPKKEPEEARPERLAFTFDCLFIHHSGQWRSSWSSKGRTCWRIWGALVFSGRFVHKVFFFNGWCQLRTLGIPTGPSATCSRTVSAETQQFHGCLCVFICRRSLAQTLQQGTMSLRTLLMHFYHFIFIFFLGVYPFLTLQW